MFDAGKLMSFVWAAVSIVFIVLLLFVLILIAGDVGDVAYTMLSGAVVGFVTAAISLSKGIRPGRCAFLIFSAIVGSVIGSFFSLLLLKITTVSLFGSTALVFDLAVGIVGAIRMR
jgi:hypothetical protein